MTEATASQNNTGQANSKNSIRFWIMIVIGAYFALGLYWAFVGLNFTAQSLSDQYVRGLLFKGPWWWAIMYYASEGIAGTIGSIFRAAAGLFALYSAVLFWRKKESALPTIRGKVGTALLFEAIYFLSFIPFTIAAFAYNLSSENLYYFDHTPASILLYVTAIPTLMMVIFNPALLLKLRSKVIKGGSSQEIIKWSCLTAVSYLFAVFWLSYSMSWVGNMVPYSRSVGQDGMSFLLEPINFANFIITVLGLFLIAATALIAALPAIKKQPNKLNLRHIGAVMTAFGGYFIFETFYYYLTGGYAAHPNVWYEIIGIGHNPNLLWCATFVFLGLALLTSRKSKE
jgi:hypothetical protein